MRCPNCLDEYEAGVTRCATCHVALVDDATLGDQAAAPPGTTPLPDRGPSGQVHLGSFHPRILPSVLGVVRTDGVAHTVTEGDDAVSVTVDAAARDRLRADLLLRWDELLETVDADDAPEVLGSGTHAPGWFDAPAGGHIDRDGRLVVEADDGDGRRTLGPALLAGGAILAVSGWLVVDLMPVALLGVALAVVGLFLPR